MGFGGSYAHARAFYRAAVEALALAVPLQSAGGGGGGGADGPEASESSTARVLRGWALMESDLRCGVGFLLSGWSSAKLSGLWASDV